MAEHRLMLIMAHPDDAEFGAGGLMTYWYRAGHPIKILCLTNGNAGTTSSIEVILRPVDLARQAKLLHKSGPNWKFGPMMMAA